MRTKRQTNLKTLLVISVVLLAALSPNLQAAGTYSGGTGDPNDPYLIADANDMQEIGANSDDWDKHFKLMNNIDLGRFTGTSFNIIGTDPFASQPPDDSAFMGVFDGNGHTLSNFTYGPTDVSCVGIFSVVMPYYPGYGGIIKNLGLVNPNVDAGAGDCVGGVVGMLILGGEVRDCYVAGGSITGNRYVGGLVGGGRTSNQPYFALGQGKIVNSSASCNVIGNECVGGLIGENILGTLVGCSSTATVSGTTNVGGLIGYSQLIDMPSNAMIVDCYSTGSVVGDSNVGGLIGNDLWGVPIVSCYSAGSVTGATNVGGLIGYNPDDGYGNFAEVNDSFWDVNTSGEPNSAGGTGKTTAEMHDPNTFMNAGWDFVGLSDGPSDIWAELVGGGYPILSWQLLPLPPLPAFSGGTGKPHDPYLISTAAELNSISHNPRLIGAHFKLVNNINLDGTDLHIIGNEVYPFVGSFDGNGFKILNFSYTCTNQSYIGLFRVVEGVKAQIKDVGLIDPNVNAGIEGYSVGSLIGISSGGTVSNCYAEGGTVSGYSEVGGLIGATGFYGQYLPGGKIIDCYATCNISGDFDAGGLVGNNTNQTTLSKCYAGGKVSGSYSVGGLAGNNSDSIEYCYSIGSVTGDTVFVGGLVGTNHGTISDSYATGSVTGNRKVGGLVGTDFEVIFNCYSTGSVSGNEEVGGLVGSNFQTGPALDSFWDIETCLPATTSAGGVGMPTEQMQSAFIFTAAGWDFVGESANGTDDFWDICDEMNYPKLSWQIPLSGDFVCPDGVEMNDLDILIGQWLFEEISMDLAPDGVVDLLDWAILADGWQVTYFIDDLTVFAEQWLKTGPAYCIADIAPPPDGDGKVNLLDFALFAEHWLEGIQ